MTSRPLVSVVIPVLRDTDQLVRQLQALGSEPSVEIIVANGDPGDPSLRALTGRFPAVRWCHCAPGRATQMNAGAAVAVGRWLLFLHADTRLAPAWSEELRRVDQDETASVGGAFAFRLAHPGVMARLLEIGVTLRVRWCGLPYGDQGIFVRRDAFEAVGGYAPLPIMEDIDLVRRLRREGPMIRSWVPIAVSARRWERDGWLRRSVLNMWLVASFYVGVSPDRLARRYYGDRGRPVPPPDVDPGGGHEAFESDLRVVVIIPALNEEDAIPAVLKDVPEYVRSVTVVDNGSTDRTAEQARLHGARVVDEPRRGYGRACLAGLAATRAADVVVFLDADRSDYPSEMSRLLAPIAAGDADLVMGARAGVGRPVAARLGTWVCVTLINWLWQTSYRDLGPFRAIRRTALDRLAMVDETWGWTIEMQVKAAEAGLRILEVPVGQRPRIGTSKISGTVLGTIRAGGRMVTTIASLRWTRRHRMSP